MEEIKVITICKSCESIFNGSHLLDRCPKCEKSLLISLSAPVIIKGIVALDAIGEMRNLHEFDEAIEALEDAGWIYEPYKEGFQAFRKITEEELEN